MPSLCFGGRLLLQISLILHLYCNLVIQNCSFWATSPPTHTDVNSSGLLTSSAGTHTIQHVVPILFLPTNPLIFYFYFITRPPSKILLLGGVASLTNWASNHFGRSTISSNKVPCIIYLVDYLLENISGI